MKSPAEWVQGNDAQSLPLHATPNFLRTGRVLTCGGDPKIERALSICPVFAPSPPPSLQSWYVWSIPQVPDVTGN
jgi:hypothetical protein